LNFFFDQASKAAPKEVLLLGHWIDGSPLSQRQFFRVDGVYGLFGISRAPAFFCKHQKKGPNLFYFRLVSVKFETALYFEARFFNLRGSKWRK
jgi:hypothetical protein